MRDTAQSEPDIKLAGLSIWVLSRQFPDLHDYWDGNWLTVIARVEAKGSFVESQGPFLRIVELREFQTELARVYNELVGTAELRTMEPDLQVTVTCDNLGHVTVTVEITPDHLAQRHLFEFSVDQTYLAKVLSEIGIVLDRFPLRGATDAADG